MRCCLALMMAVLSGCPAINSKPCASDTECADDQRCRRGACGPICVNDGECGGGQTCQNGRCDVRPECAENTECAAGFECSTGKCTCTSDAVCAANQTCTAGTCVTRTRCKEDKECSTGTRCEITQGLCVPTCRQPADCAPNLPAQAAAALYVCRAGTCVRFCTTDVTCGGQGLICRDGLCATADCSTKADCPAAQYCTSATFGRCETFTTCSTSSQCDRNARCERFSTNACPPGFDCTQSICRELPRCFIDSDCVSGVPPRPSGYCAEGHCQPSATCVTSATCMNGNECIGGLCVPSVCRGHSSCGPGQACVAPGCTDAPSPTELARLGLHPAQASLVVGDSLQLTFTGYRLDQSTFPLSAGTFTVVDEAGMPSANVTVTSTGRVTAIAAGKVVVRAQVMTSFASPTEMRLTIYPRVTSGRRVVVFNGPQRTPLAGAIVRGCLDADCSSPNDVTTGADGVAAFPALGAGPATFTAASPALRTDGKPTWERVSIVSTTSTDLLIPLRENPVAATSGFNGSVGFQQVRQSGTYWIGLIATSIVDLPAMRLSSLLGDPVYTEINGINQRVPVPGAAVLYTSPAFNFPQDVKPRSFGFGQAGDRAAVAFATRGELADLVTLRSVDLLSYVGAADFTVQRSVDVTTRLDVADTTDINGNGLCSNVQRCPMGTEDVPDWAGFTRLTLAPNQPLARRTEIAVPRVPSNVDTVIAAGVELDAFRGAVPTGFASKTPGAPAADGTRPVDELVLRTGLPFAGIESSETGVWMLGASTRTGAETSRLFRASGALPLRILTKAFLPLIAAGSLDALQRRWSAEQSTWNSAHSNGADVARLSITGSAVRHTIFFAMAASQSGIHVPLAPSVPGQDPAGQADSHLELAAIDLIESTPVDDLFSFEGVNLTTWLQATDGYSRVDR